MYSKIKIAAIVGILFVFFLAMLSTPSITAEKWILICSDPDEGAGCNLKEVYYKVSHGTIYFKVVYYRPINDVGKDIDTAVLLDVDENINTGYYVDNYPNASTGLGAEYLIVIGNQSLYVSPWPTIMVRANSSTSWDIDNLLPPDYYDIPVPGTVATVGYSLSKLGNLGSEIKVSIGDVFSEWDWCPDSGNVTIYVPRSVGGRIVSSNIPTALVASLVILGATVAMMMYARRK